MRGSEIKFGIIGCGFIGGYHAEAISSIEGLRLVSVCDKNGEQSERLSRKYGCAGFCDIDKFLASDIDAVAVCLPPVLHREAVVKAADAGKHVICEKPIALDDADSEFMTEHCKKHCVKFAVIMQHRFDEAAAAVKKSIISGAIGNLLWASAHCVLYRSEEYYKNHKWHSDSGSGALINQSIHYIDLLLFMMGDAVSVSGMCEKRLNYAGAGQDSSGSEDVGLALVKFANGAPAVIEGTTVAFPGLYNELSVYGENGTFIIRNDKLFKYELKDGSRRELDMLFDPYAVFTRFRDASIDVTSHKAQYSDFASAIMYDREPSVNGTEAQKSLRLINAIYASSDTGRTVYL